MNRQEAELLAKKLLIKFDLEDVNFKWSRGKRQLGCAVWYHGRRAGERELRLSCHLVDLNEFHEVNDVIRHEIAHFKAGRHAKHGPVWKNWALICGANPSRTSHTANTPEPLYGIYCPCCNRVVARRHRKKMQLHKRLCIHCGDISIGKLRWIIN